jgi:hypothetical protein
MLPDVYRGKEIVGGDYGIYEGRAQVCSEVRTHRHISHRISHRTETYHSTANSAQLLHVKRPLMKASIDISLVS